MTSRHSGRRRSRRPGIHGPRFGLADNGFRRSLRSAGMTGARCFVVIALLSLCSCEQPHWPETLTRYSSLCEYVSTSDYVVRVTPRKVLPPEKVKLSPWAQELWVTPVEWSVDQTVLTLPVANAHLAPLRTVERMIFAKQFTDDRTTRFMSVSVVDGQLLALEPSSFTFDGTSWGRAEDRSADGFQYAFKTEAELASALNTAAGQPECARFDWVKATRDATNSAAAP